ncbi:MAG TPA: NCS2 family permease, partial [Thermoguttaceae bacterium]|nr:NCS2 family permease [Thermoguttaceae bacterium]
MFDRYFELSKHGTNLRTELLAGLTTFLTMAYIIFVQPGVLSGAMFGQNTGLDFGAVMTATCLAAALATGIMGLYARLPVAQAPGMGENFFFVFSLLPAASALMAAQIDRGQLQPAQTTPWQIGLGVIFISGVLFLILSLLGVREMLLEAISPTMRHGIAVGIGLFIAFIGLENGSLVIGDPGTLVKLNPRFAAPDLIVFGFGLLVTAGLHARRVRGAIVWGILAATVLALLILHFYPRPEIVQDLETGKVKTEQLSAEQKSQAAEWEKEWAKLQKLAEAKSRLLTEGPVATPPSLTPTFLKMDLRRAISWAMWPFILIFLFMNLFDTLGTLIGVTEQAGLVRDNKIPRIKQALVSDAIGTVAGAAMGTSTVVSFVESASGVAQGGRTGLTALVVAGLFLVALCFSPIVALVGSYPPITAPALVVIGSMMIRGVTRMDWSNEAEIAPAFLIILGIPLTYSIADGLALGFIAYPIIKLLAGQGRDVRWLMYLLALVLLAYFIFVRV